MLVACGEMAELRTGWLEKQSGGHRATIIAAVSWGGRGSDPIQSDQCSRARPASGGGQGEFIRDQLGAIIFICDQFGTFYVTSFVHR